MKTKLIITLIILLFVTTGVGVVIFKTNSSPTGSVIEESNIKEIRIDAVRFKYTPDTITVKAGQKVKIIINNIDTPHGIRIPEFKVQGENIIEFTPDKKGEFNWYCLIPCGKSHMQMKGKLIVK